MAVLLQLLPSWPWEVVQLWQDFQTLLLLLMPNYILAIAWLHTEQRIMCCYIMFSFSFLQMENKTKFGLCLPYDVCTEKVEVLCPGKNNRTCIPGVLWKVPINHLLQAAQYDRMGDLIDISALCRAIDFSCLFTFQLSVIKYVRFHKFE